MAAGSAAPDLMGTAAISPLVALLRGEDRAIATAAAVVRAATGRL
jgi:hypothetical protein